MAYLYLRVLRLRAGEVWLSVLVIPKVGIKGPRDHVFCSSWNISKSRVWPKMSKVNVFCGMDSFCRLTLFSDVNAIYQFDWVNSKNNVSQLCYFAVFHIRLLRKQSSNVCKANSVSLQKLSFVSWMSWPKSSIRSCLDPSLYRFCYILQTCRATDKHNGKRDLIAWPFSMARWVQFVPWERSHSWEEKKGDTVDSRMHVTCPWTWRENNIRNMISNHGLAF